MRQKEYLARLRESYKVETGEDPGPAGAKAIMEQEMYAFTEAYAAEPAYAVAQRPDLASVLLNHWFGEDRKALKALVDAHTANLESQETPETEPTEAPKRRGRKAA